MTIRISIFNHKGGVGKTTLTFQLGRKLAELGSRTLLVDADPQCNLTGLALTSGETSIGKENWTIPDDNFMTALAPAFEGQPKFLEGVAPIEVSGIENLFLLPGHIGMAEYDLPLGLAHAFNQSLPTLRNLPGAPSYVIKKTAEASEVEFVLVDLNPSLCALNQNLVSTSDYILVPVLPDHFARFAIESLSRILPVWHSWHAQAITDAGMQSADYLLNGSGVKFLGYILQYSLTRDNQLVNVNDLMQQRLLPTLESAGMLSSRQEHEIAIMPFDPNLAIRSNKPNIPRDDEYESSLETIARRIMGTTDPA